MCVCVTVMRFVVCLVCTYPRDGCYNIFLVWYQGGVKATVSGVVEDLKFKISEGSDPNWCFPDSAHLAD